jgi:hypothetical protein
MKLGPGLKQYAGAAGQPVRFGTLLAQYARYEVGNLYTLKLLFNILVSVSCIEIILPSVLYIEPQKKILSQVAVYIFEPVIRELA